MSAAPEEFLAKHGRKLNSSVAGHIKPITIRNATDVRLDLDAPYVIKRRVNPREISGWYGPSTCGKTFLLQHVFWRVAQGLPVMGCRVRGGPVVYFSMEPGLLDLRLTAAAAVYGETDQFYFCEDVLNLFAGRTAAQQIVEIAREYGAAVVVIDPISAAMAGANENDYEDVSAVIETLRWIATTANTHVACIAHTGKDADKGQRGSSHFYASFDLVVSISEDPSGDRIAEIVKARDAKKGDEIRFRLNEFVLGTDKEGDEWKTLTVEMIEGPSTRRQGPPAKLSDFQQIVLKDALNLLADDHHTELGIRPRDGMPGVTAVRRDSLRRELQKNGRLESQNGEKITRKDIGKVRDALVALERKSVLCATDEWVWRP